MQDRKDREEKKNLNDKQPPVPPTHPTQEDIVPANPPKLERQSAYRRLKS